MGEQFDCRRVQEHDGFYNLDTSLAREHWGEVKARADEIERIEDLKGWGPYTASYRVFYYGRGCDTYFVREE